ncbi:MAG: hypothetical protein QXV74_00760 [Candidatus Bathyarchaeia archaeon]
MKNNLKCGSRLGFTMLTAALIVWGISLLVKNPKNVLRGKAGK